MSLHALDSERQVIGAILVHQKYLIDAMACVQGDDFHHPAHRSMFDAFVALQAANKPVDAVTTMEQLRSDGTADRLNAVGGESYLGDLMAGLVTVSGIDYHAKTVASKARRRRWQAALLELNGLVLGDNDDDGFFAAAESKLLALSIDRQARGVRSMKQILREVILEVGKRHEHRGALIGVTTGLERLDFMTGGWKPGELIIVAARPSMGKTALAINMTVAAGTPALIFSLEMSGESLVERVIASEGPINATILRTGELKSTDFLAMSRAGSRLADTPIAIDDTGAITFAELRSQARRWRAKVTSDKALVVVDYLQLMRGSDRAGNREQEISELSRGLKLLAKELRCPVIALSQLNRSLESRADKRPMLSDLRESGAIEQDADVVVFIYRDEVYSREHCKEEDRGVAELIVGKQRNGPVGVVRVGWQEKITKFVNLTRG